MSFGTEPEIKKIVEGHASKYEILQLDFALIKVTDNIKETNLKYIHYEAVVTFHVAI